MSEYNINKIARLITEDPDIFNEEASIPGQGMNKPLNSAEISQEADNLTNTPDASNEVAQQMRQAQDAQKQNETERQRVLGPQMKNLNQAMNQLNTGLVQGQQAAAAGAKQFSGLDKSVNDINTMLQSLENNI